MGKAELLAAFTRSSFAYKEDKEYFGYSKPMVAEEVFLYPFRTVKTVLPCISFAGNSSASQ